MFAPERVIIIDPYDHKVQQYDVNSLEEVKEVLKENLPFCSQGHPEVLHLGVAYVVEWESLPETKLVIRKPQDVDALR
jgi:hypothetical protein